MSDAKPVSPLTTYWILLGLALLSFVPTLFLPYSGEEGVYTITSMEMVHRGEWMAPSLYGEAYPRPPLMNWLMIPLSHLLGWNHVLIASRLVAAAATIGTGLLLVAWVWRLHGNHHVALLSALFFFSGDVLFYRGWLAYADPLFGFFIFMAIASMLWAIHENRSWLLTGALVGLIGSFMSKALTGYVFYATALLVVFAIEKEKRRVLTSSSSLLLHAMAVVYPLFWWGWVEGTATTHGMVQLLIDKLIGGDAPFALSSYAGERLAFIGETFMVLLPGSALTACLIVYKRRLPALTEMPFARAMLWWIALCYLPYLLSPSTNIRYILPLYPWCAVLFAALLMQFTAFKPGRWVPLLLGAMIAIKFVVGAGALWWYEMNPRDEDFRETARHVIAQTTGHPLYIVDSSHLGLSVTAHIDSLRFPHAPLLKPGSDWTDAFVLAREYHFPDDRVVATYTLPGGALLLRCRGRACAQ